MNVVDSSGWLEYFADSENAAFFAPAIEDSANLLVPVLCIYEVFKRILLQSGLSAAQTHVGDMYTGQIIAIDASLALSAAQLSVEKKLPMADSLILAISRTHNATLWTQDEHFKGMPGVQYAKKARVSIPAQEAPMICARKTFDIDAYIADIQNRPCFICEMAAGRLNGNHVIYQNDTFIAFLNKYPPLVGYTLVAPIQHKEHVVGDFTLDEYLALQRAVYRVAEAVQRSVETERLYVLSLGSQQGNRHVHWHIAPLPYGVPFKQQQLAALSVEDGILALTEAEMAEFAAQIRKNLAE